MHAKTSLDLKLARLGASFGDHDSLPSYHLTQERRADSAHQPQGPDHRDLPREGGGGRELQTYWHVHTSKHQQQTQRHSHAQCAPMHTCTHKYTHMNDLCPVKDVLGSVHSQSNIEENNSSRDPLPFLFPTSFPFRAPLSPTPHHTTTPATSFPRPPSLSAGRVMTWRWKTRLHSP